jgi:uncharacterized membrane protein
VSTTATDVVVDLPVRTVYDQWTQFEEFPHFMSNVDEVRQLDDRHLHWTAKVYGVKREWDAEIVEQVPDQCISWRSIEGAQNVGTVRFEAIEPSKTRVMLDLRFDPEGAGEKIADVTGIVEDRAEKDLKQFKKFIEERGRETGAFREELPRKA